jgi:hypothetical protein
VLPAHERPRNLDLGGYLRTNDKAGMAEDMDRVFDLFRA